MITLILTPSRGSWAGVLGDRSVLIRVRDCP